MVHWHHQGLKRIPKLFDSLQMQHKMMDHVLCPFTSQENFYEAINNMVELKITLSTYIETENINVIAFLSFNLKIILLKNLD